MKPDITQLIAEHGGKAILWAITMFGLVKVAHLYFKENSVGKSAMIKLKEDHAKVREELEEFKRDHAELREDVEHIESKYEKLIEKILNNFPFNK